MVFCYIIRHFIINVLKKIKIKMYFLKCILKGLFYIKILKIYKKTQNYIVIPICVNNNLFKNKKLTFFKI